MEKKLQQGDKLHGFTVTRVRENEELGGRLVEMIFDQTRTPLYWVDEGEDNKLFSVNFRTLPEDSTGVFHILEHSTLCGSRKFPVREPFVELAKSSLNTFLNAMTGQDCTYYPVSSRNSRDFLNLAEVYLDGVFAPRLLEDDNIFFQEGWHLEEGEDGNLRFKGVVFNEMKGAMSDPDRQIGQEMDRLLFGETPFGHLSGGSPEHIPDLTPEKFRETYRRFYHPSNAMVFLDGNVPLEEILTLLEEYLSGYEVMEDLPRLSLPHLEGKRAEMSYSLSREEPLENKTRLALGKVIMDQPNRVRQTALSLACSVIAGNNEAPLTRAVLSSSMAENVELAVEDTGLQTILAMEVANVKDGCEEKLLELMWTTLENTLQESLPRDQLESILTRLELQIREPRENPGMDHMEITTDSWLLGQDPLENLTFDETFRQLREMVEKDEITAIAREVLLNRDSMMILTARPSHTLEEEIRQREQERLSAIRQSMGEEELSALRAKNAALTLWQQTPDTPEQLATLPRLKLADVELPKEVTPTEVSQCLGSTLLYHPQHCRGIVYGNLYFKLTDFAPEDLYLLMLAGPLFAQLPTAKHTALEKMTLRRSLFGDLHIGRKFVSQAGEKEQAIPMLEVNFTVLREKLPQAFEFLRENLLETRFDDSQRMGEIARQVYDNLRRSLPNMAPLLGKICAQAALDAEGGALEAAQGPSAIARLEELVDHFGERWQEVADFFQRIQQKTFCRERLAVSFTGDEPVNPTPFLQELPQGEPAPEGMRLSPTLPRRLGVVLPGRVSCLSQFAIFPREGNGAWRVGDTILSLGYLWNQIRVQGGAYGCAQRMLAGFHFYASTFRDPTPARSLKILEAMPQALETFADSGESMEQYIISTIGEMTPLAAPREKGANADILWLRGIPNDQARIWLRDVMNATPQDLRDYARLIRRQLEEGALCVAGPKASLEGLEGLKVIEL